MRKYINHMKSEQIQRTTECIYVSTYYIYTPLHSSSDALPVSNNAYLTGIIERYPMHRFKTGWIFISTCWNNILQKLPLLNEIDLTIKNSIKFAFFNHTRTFMPPYTLSPTFRNCRKTIAVYLNVLIQHSILYSIHYSVH